MAKRSQKKKKPPEVKASQLAVEEPKEIPPLEEIPDREFPVLSWKVLVQALVIATAVLWIYWPALHGGWLWDDHYLVTDNAVMSDPDGLWKIWFDPGILVDYQPLKVSVVWLQWQLWGDDTLGYHLTNVFLHILGALLVWRLLSKLGLRLAWLGGLIFAIHPAQVESVAWIAELKNTLSLPPFLLAMCFYIDYDDDGRAKDYWVALGLFLIAMLCKTTMVMFPVIILLYAWWKRGRLEWKDARASAPFFIVSLALGLVTLWFLHTHAMHNTSIPRGGMLSRLACAGLSIAFYFSTCFLPVGLIPIYPQWVVDPPTLAQFLPWPILGGLIYWLWTKRQDWGRHALLGLGFFLVNLAPFVGINTASYMAYTWVMIHILYIPLIGLIGLVTASWGEIEHQLPAPLRLGAILLGGLGLALLSLDSRNNAKMYLNEGTLWAHELKYNPDAYEAHINIGRFLMEKGQVSEAMDQFEQVLRIDPEDTAARDSLGMALLQTGRAQEAMEQFKRALRVKPDFAEARISLGLALEQTGHASEAMDQYMQALRIKPDSAEAHYYLGTALLKTGQTPQAIGQLEQALQIKPNVPKAHDNLGLALLKTGQPAQAIDQFEQALRLDPNDVDTHNNLGTSLAQMGRLVEAMDQFKQALAIKPDDVDAGYNLATALLKTGHTEDAIAQYWKVLQIKPDYAEAHNNLGNALQLTGRFPEAMQQFEEALRLKPDFAAARNNLAKLQGLQKNASTKTK